MRRILAQLKHKLQPYVLGILMPGVVVALAACGPTSQISDRGEGQEWRNVVLGDAPFPVARELRVLIWHDYLDPDLVSHFESRYRIRIHADFFSTNEELYAMIQRAEVPYDLIMPSGYMVEKLREEGFLQPLGREYIPNFGRIDARFFGLQFDPGLEYSLPLFYYGMGVAINVQYVAGMPLDWQALAKSGSHPLVRGRRALIDEMRVAMGTALIMLGYDANTTDPAEIRRAGDFLVDTIRTGGLRFYNDEMPDKLAEEEVLVAVGWNGAAGAALRRNGMVRFVIPQGPVVTGVDCFAIPANAREVNTARLFLDYLLIPEVTAALSNYSTYANTSSSSRGFVLREIRNGPGYMFPLADSAVFLKELGSALEYYEETWSRVKATPQPPINPLPLPTSHLERRGAGAAPNP